MGGGGGGGGVSLPRLQVGEVWVGGGPPPTLLAESLLEQVRRCCGGGGVASPAFTVVSPCSTEPDIWGCCGRHHSSPAKPFSVTPLPQEHGHPPSLRSPQPAMGPGGSWAPADPPVPARVARCSLSSELEPCHPPPLPTRVKGVAGSRGSVWKLGPILLKPSCPVGFF